MQDSAPRHPTPRPSAAAIWAPLARFIAGESRLGHWAGKRRTTAFIYEVLRFGVKQAWACLFGGILVGLIIATYFCYPRNAWLAHYDFLFLAAVAVQVVLLYFRLETLAEAKVILLFHIVGTAMEVFKTSVGSFTQTWSLHGNTAYLTQTLTLEKPRVAPSEYPELRELWFTAAAAEADPVRFVKKSS